MDENKTDSNTSNATNSTNDISNASSKGNLPLGLTVEIISGFILLENSLILLTLKLSKKWKVVDLLVFSLSLADFVNAALPVQVVNIKANLVPGPWSAWLCALFVWATYTLRIVSNSTVTLMSVEQALLLYQPLRHYTQMTLPFIRKLVLFTWGVSAIAAAFPKLFESESSGISSSSCRYQPSQMGFAFGVFVVSLGVAQLAVVLGSYVALVLSSKGFLQRQRSMMASQKRNQRHRESGNEAKSDSRSSQRQKIREETQGMLQARQLCRVMGYVVLLYYVTWLPFLAYNLYNLLTRSTVYSHRMVTIVGTCSLATPILNPFLYVKMVSRYRKGVVFILKRVAAACCGNRFLSKHYDRRECFGLQALTSSTSSGGKVLSTRREAGPAVKISTTTLTTLCEA